MNNHKMLHTMGRLAMASIDKKAATELASSLVLGAASRHRNPTLRMLAGLATQKMGESASGQTAAHQHVRAQGNGQGWQRALDVMNTASVRSPADSAQSDQAQGEPSPRRSKPDSDVLHGLLTGYYDTANIGKYTFSLMNGVQLQVGSPREPGSVGGQFWLENMPADSWRKLKDRGGRILPIWIQWRGNELRVTVGDGPSNAQLLIASDAGR